MIHKDAFSKMGKFFKIVWPVMYGPGDTCGSNLLQVLIIIGSCPCTKGWIPKYSV